MCSTHVMCSATARIGAFIGPYMTLLYNTLDPRIVFSIFGGMAALASFLAYFNSDSSGKPIPSIPEDLVHLHFVSGLKNVEDEELSDL